MLTKNILGGLVLPAYMAVAAPAAFERVVKRDFPSSMTLWYTAGYEYDYYTMTKDDTCLRPVVGSWADVNANAKFDLKPTNVYGHTDCTYTYLNDALADNANGILNCPTGGGPTNVQCYEVPDMGAGWQPANNNCKPKTNGKPTSGVWVASAICQW